LAQIIDVLRRDFGRFKNKNHNQVIKILTKHFGFIVERQGGSHIQLKHKDGRRVTVPKHDPIKVGVLNQ
jgi:predicted RNA binding protein YcfA (HicA-like mRNA interferase family)